METFSLAALFSTASLLLIFLWRSLRLLRPGHASSDTQLQYALALRSAALYVLSGALPLIFPCEQAQLGWADCPSHWLIPTNLMRIFHYLPFWYAFLLTPYLGGLASAIHDAILGVGTGLAGASLINLLMPGGAGGPHYLPGEYFERAWLPLRYSTTGAFLFALCFTYGLFFSKLSVGKKQYALGLFSELLVPFMNPQTRTGFRAVCWDWDFSWNWNGAAMCGFWLVLLAVLLSVLTLGLKPWSFQSVERHTALWASANALAQVAEDTAGCLEYLMTILQKDHWKFQFHADSSNFYIRHLGLRRSRAEALLDLVAWEKGLLPSAKQENLLKVAAFLRQLRQLLRIQSEHMRYFGPSFAAGEHLAVEEFLETCSEGLGLVAQDLRQRADLSEETCAELQRLGNRGDKVLLAVVRGFAQEKRSSRHLAFVDKLRSWPKAFRSLSPDAPSAAKPAATPAASDWAERHWFALRNTTSWTLALLWSLYSRNYSCGCVVATSFIFSQTSGSSFDVNINRILGVGMGLAVGNFPALLILDGSTLGSSVCGSFMYFAVMFVMWSLAIFGYLATDSKYFRACLLWAALGGVQMLRHLPRFSRMDVELFMAILDNVLAIMVVFFVDMVFAYWQAVVFGAGQRCFGAGESGGLRLEAAVGNHLANPVKVDCDLGVETIATKPIEGQKPGTSGLRKKTKEFMEGTYLANFVQSVFNTLGEEGVPLAGGTLVVSGDGRFWNPEAIQIIIKMAFAAGVGRVWCGTGGLLSTPATSAVIRARGKGMEPFGGFICSASHNPGGINDDFGIKYNCENGGPAPEKVTNKMLEWTAKITELKTCSKIPDFDLSKPETYELPEGKVVEVFDCVEDHLKVLKQCFDFESIKKLIAMPEFSMTYDSMCGVQGPYARKIFEGELGAAAGTCKNAEPLPDFGGPSSAWHGHADPNLTYAVELVKDMGLTKEGNKADPGKPIPTFGAAADGDADRNMICGTQFFVSPSDSLAMIVANSNLIPQFKEGLKGCARSMPTSAALDLVAAKKGIPCFEVPTGWPLG
ncbi:unnamed protein product, partial [Effrenium voratum]